MLLDYLVPSRTRRELWKALGAPGPAPTVRALAGRAGVPYSNAHREVLRMREMGLLRTERVGNALVCRWDPRNPEVRQLTALLGAGRRSGGAGFAEDRVYAGLKAWGAGLARETGAAEPLALEDSLAFGVALARRDPDVAQVWPVVLAKNRGEVRLDRLEALVRRLGEKRALGFLLSLTGELLGDPSLGRFAKRFRDSRIRKAQDFFTLPRGRRASALAEANTPDLARRWHFRLNTSLESFRSHFEKFGGGS